LLYNKIMAGQKLQTFFGDDLEETLDSLLSAPGAFGNIIVGVVRQVRIVDAVMFALVILGWGWLVFGYALEDNDDTMLLSLAILPTVLWLFCGLVGGLIFEIGGVGWRTLAYWEAYLLMLVFIAMGVITLRLAVNPRDRQVYRGPTAKGGTT
jgi:hypothetical protein